VNNTDAQLRSQASGQAPEGRAGEHGRPHGPWKIVASNTVYRDRWMDIQKDDVIRPDGLPGTHGVVRIRLGVSVLALDDDGFVYLTDEFHYAVGRQTLEAVSGGIEDGEEAAETARRELREELGIVPRELIPMGTIDPFTTMIVSPAQLFVARGLSFVETSPEGTEQIVCVKTPLATAVEMVLDGRITHAPTCVLVLKTQLLFAPRSHCIAE
jgi:ADP-ribose pyrophosphatase